MENEHAKQKRIVAPPIVLEEEADKPEVGKRKFEDVDSETEEDEDEACSRPIPLLLLHRARSVLQSISR